MFFFVCHTRTPSIYTLSLHDALPICMTTAWAWLIIEPKMYPLCPPFACASLSLAEIVILASSSIFFETLSPLKKPRSEEHTSELQSLRHLVCRLLLEKKKTLQKCHQV